jgi:hypothetical protein
MSEANFKRRTVWRHVFTHGLVFVTSYAEHTVQAYFLKGQFGDWFGGSRFVSKCPRFVESFLVEVDDVITQSSGFCFIKAWTSGQPVQVSEVWRKFFWLRLNVITQSSGFCFIKAWTSGQPVQMSEVCRKLRLRFWLRLMTSSHRVNFGGQ